MGGGGAGGGGGGVNMANPPPFHVTDFFSNSPALSLSLAGIFRHGAAAPEKLVDLGEGNINGWLTNSENSAVEITNSENSAAPVRTRTTSDEDELDIHDKLYSTNNKRRRRRRKKYHRHTAHQIQQMELLFKESPHPDDTQRHQLSKQLDLSARQVKFWFQNRRTQIKAMQERHDNSLMKTEMEKIMEENNALKELAIKNVCCPSCGFATISSQSQEEQNLRIENAQLKAEIQKLRSAIENDTIISGGIFEYRSRIMKLVGQATEELMTMATMGEPLWVRNNETGREILNYVEYKNRFIRPCSNWNEYSKRKLGVEVSRETRVVLADITMLLQSFMDVNHWKEMFPYIISRAATLDVINTGELLAGNHHRNGAVQLMVAELQMLTPTIATRQVCFVRHCKQLSSKKWVIVDASIHEDNKTSEDNNNINNKFSKRPSGCVIEDQCNGRCKVTWVEHWECHENCNYTSSSSTVPTSILMYHDDQIINDGTAPFGARRWVATLGQQCERLVYLMATNIPARVLSIHDIGGARVHDHEWTVAGRKSILGLAERMTRCFCEAIGAAGASSFHDKWIKLPNRKEYGDIDIRVSYRKNVHVLNDPGEVPVGVILCAASSVWLHVSHLVLADFLTDATRRHQWDIMSNGNPAQCLAKFAKGQDKGNSVTIQASRSSENNKRIVLQDSSWNGCESLVVYGRPVDASSLQSMAMKAGGAASGGVADDLLPSGFCILPVPDHIHGVLESRSSVVDHDHELGMTSVGGCFLTLAFQVLATNNSSPTNVQQSMESDVESLSALLLCTLTNIKTSLHI